MKERAFNSIFWSAVLCAVLVYGTAHAAEPMVIYPYKALIVQSAENWGCLVGQRVLSDATTALSRADGSSVRIEASTASEDREIRNEIYLYFPALNMNTLPGYLILRLTIANGERDHEGYALVGHSMFFIAGNDCSFEVNAIVKGKLSAALAYSGHVGLESGAFTCPEGDLFEARSTDFIRAYPIDTGLKIAEGPADGKWKRYTISVLPPALENALVVGACEVFLDSIDKALRVQDRATFLWERSAVTASKLRELLLEFHQTSSVRHNLSVTINDRGKVQEINPDGHSFVPILKQRISVRDAKGRLIGGEIWLGIR